MTMEFYVFPASPRAFKVLAVANHLGLDYTVKVIDFAKGELTSPAYLQLNPNARMPTMKDGDFVLWEANAILQYLADRKPDSGLFPQDERKRLDIVRWQFWDMAHLDGVAGTYMFENAVKAFMNMGPPDTAQLAKAEENFHRAAKVLDGHLKGKTYICNNALTIADFSLGAWFNAAPIAKIPVEPYSEILRWHKGLMALPAWSKTLEEGMKLAGR